MSTIKSSDVIKLNVANNDTITVDSTEVLFVGNINATGYAITANTVSTNEIIGLTVPVSKAYTASFISSSVLSQNITITGSLTVITGSAIELQVTDTGVRIGNVVTDTHTVTGSFNISGSLLVNGITGSLFGTSSWATQALTASLAPNYVLTSATSSMLAPYVLSSQTSSFITNTQTASFATTGSNTFRASQIISGSLTITNDLIVFGSSSINYVSQSTLNIGTNLITVNANSPSVRFGGLSVIDSGSSPQRSGSILFDSTNNQWIFVHQNDGGVVTSSVFIQGPQNFNNLGNETTLTANRVPKATGGDLGEHIGDSNITDTGTLVSINSNTAVTGSFTVITGSTVELQVTNTGIRIGSIITDAHYVTGSFNISGSLLVNGTAPGGSSVKAGSGSAVSFTGSPRTSSFTFTSAFSNNSYAVTVTGEDARSWSIESKTAAGFTINTNSTVALSGPVYWIATPFGS